MWVRQECNVFFDKRVRVKGTNSCSTPRLPPGQVKQPLLTNKGVFLFSILLLLALSSCTKQPDQRSRAIRERDSVARIQELRDSIAGSLLISKGIASQERISSDIALKEKGLMLVDTLVGTVYVSGNEPFTRLTLAMKDGRSSIYIQADTTQSKQLRKMQGRVVKISGPIVKSGTGECIRVNKFVIVQ